MSQWAKIYSEYGLQKMINEANEKIQEKEKEKENVGQSWSAEKVKTHRKMLDEEITTERKLISELEKALKTHKRTIGGD